MAPRSRFVTAAALLVVLLAVAAWGRAQGVIGARPVVPPVVLAGPDVGFRMTAQKGGTPVGQLVVRINGEWKVVEFGGNVLPLGK